MPSIRSFFRARRTSRHGRPRSARTSQRGFALFVALILAVLYFAFIELLMIDASRELSEARRFRARVRALTLAENGAEIAATSIVTRDTWSDEEKDSQGTTRGEMKKNPSSGDFEIKATARSSGPEGTDATVRLEGKVSGNYIQINFARHSQ